MKIGDIAMFLPAALISSVFKMSKTEIDREGKEKIVENGLYHVTSSEETANKIMESQHLRPATGLTKNITSYGRACVCFFNGTPDVENFIKNVTQQDIKLSPYLNPSMVVNAIKIKPRKIEELENYKAREITDGAIIYEGYCVLPKDETSKVYLVPDLVRDDNGAPIINEKTGKYDIKFREAEEIELKEGKASYKAKEDYLAFVASQKKKLGYTDENKAFSNARNTLKDVIHISKIERNMYNSNMKKIPSLIKRFFTKSKNLSLDMSHEEKLERDIKKFGYSSKNPYRDKDFALAVSKFQKEGLVQFELEEKLLDIANTDIGKIYKQKYSQIQQKLENFGYNKPEKSDNRQALLSVMIAKDQGLFKDNDKDRKLDVLLSAAYYHSSFKTNVDKLENLNITYFDGNEYTAQDKNILKALIKSADAKDKKISKICKKYGVEGESIQYVQKMITALKDAKELDNQSKDINIGVAMKSKINVERLYTVSAIRMLNLSYKLNNVMNNNSINDLLNYKESNKEENKFGDSLKNLTFSDDELCYSGRKHEIAKGERDIPEM